MITLRSRAIVVIPAATISPFGQDHQILAHPFRQQAV